MSINYAEKFSKPVSMQERIEIASQIETPQSVLEMFIIGDDSYRVIESALANPNLDITFITPDIQDRIDRIRTEFIAKQGWYDLLEKATEPQDRITLASRPDCPQWLLKIFITHDVEPEVVRMALDHPSVDDQLKSSGLTRLQKLESPNDTTICPIPWKHIEIAQNGDMRVCCMCIHEPFGVIKHTNDKTANIQDTTIDTARNLPLIKELRKSMVNGEKHSMCNQCWDAEKLGLKSKRKSMLAAYGYNNWEISNEDGSIDTEKYPLAYMDLRFGNLCNLKCRSCGPADSSLWADDYLALTKTESTRLKHIGGKTYVIEKVGHKAEFTVGGDEFFWYEQDNFWQQFTDNAHNIDRLYFTGGEPSINKPHYRLLDYLINKGYSQNIELEYNSNMVAVPERLYEQWENFKKVLIGCSIDGINDMANYLRPPSEWQDLEKSLDRLGYSKSKKVHGSISTTVSVYNILHLLEMAEWLLSKNYTNIGSYLNIHMLWGPEHMNVQILPKEVKEQIKEKYQKWFNDLETTHGIAHAMIYRRVLTGALNHMDYVDLSHKLPDLESRTTALDKLRNQDIRSVIPWLANIIYK